MKRAFVLVQRLLEDDFDAEGLLGVSLKRYVLKLARCNLCGLPLDWPPRKLEKPLPDPFYPYDDEDNDFGVDAEPEPSPEPTTIPEQHQRCHEMVYGHETWRGVHRDTCHVKAAFARIVQSPDKRMYFDSRFWDGDANARLYADPAAWRSMRDASRAAFFARKHSNGAHDANYRSLADFDDLARHVQQEGIRLHVDYVLQLGIMLKQLGADSFRLLKPFMDKAE